MAGRRTSEPPVVIAFVGADGETVARCRRYGESRGHRVAVLDDADASAALLRLPADAVVVDTTRLGVAGWRTARLLKTAPRWNRPAVVALIDGELAIDDDHALAARCDLHVVKPFEPDELFSLVLDAGGRTVAKSRAS